MWFCWFAASLSYHGLSLGVDFLKGSLFFNSFLSGLVEIPSYIILIMIIGKTGCKWPNIVTLFVGAVTSLACLPLFSDPDLNTILTTFLMIGKFSVASCFAILHVYAAELFPTIVRNVGVGSCSMCATFAALLQPQIALTRGFWVPLPFLIYGTTSLVAAIVSFILPEMQGKQLPEMLEDIVEKRDAGCDTKGRVDDLAFASPVQDQIYITTKM